MFSALRRRLTYTNVALTLALVFAMSGGAYAASKYVITSTKQIKPSVLKSLQGKAGKTGTNGAPGATGAAGPAGLTGPTGGGGPQGPQGPQGVQGEPGKNGENGKPGKNGETGFTETLPAGKTETGVWTFGPLSEEAAVGAVYLASFSIPLKEAIAEAHVHFINEEGKEVVFEGGEYKEKPSELCTGNVSAPTAPSGELCVYAAFMHRAEVSSNASILNAVELEPGAGTTGAVMQVHGEAFSPGNDPAGHGTWAVTG